MGFLKNIIPFILILILTSIFTLGAISDVEMVSLDNELIFQPVGSPIEPYITENTKLILLLRNNGPTLTSAEMQSNLPSISTPNFISSYGPAYVSSAGYWNPSTDFTTGQIAMVAKVGYYDTSGNKQISATFDGRNLNTPITALNFNECVDSDGEDKYTKGWTIGTTDCVNQASCIFITRSEDECVGTTLKEQICSPDPDDGILRKFYKEISCETCVNGICVDDIDNDGYDTTVDCNDNDSSINPGANEVCDNVDNDCNAGTPDGADEAWFGLTCDGTDTDLCEEGTLSCTAGTQTCSDNTGNNLELCNGADDDCNGATNDGIDEAWLNNPTACGIGECASAGNLVCLGAVQTDTCTEGLPVNETCDGLDNDCNGVNDNGVLLTFYYDFDNDLFGNLTNSIQQCVMPVDYVTDNTDCNDNNININPNAIEIPFNGIDDDCNASTPDSGTADTDDDGDNYTENEGDCNDANPNMFPGNPEVCDSIDNDCNATTSDGSAEAWYGLSCDGTDTDLCEEGTYTCTGSIQECTDHTTNNLELCNMIDDDCNSGTAEGIDETWYGQPTSCGIGECAAIGNYMCLSGSQVDSCNEGTPVAEICDGLDNDCNGVDDNGVLLTFYYDLDNDFFGNLTITQQACIAPTDYVTDNTDCNDNDNNVNPNATEILNNGIDDDCNPLTLDSSLDIDDDFDGWTENEGDCNDAEPNMFPGNPEVPYDGLDNDCNATTLDDDLDQDGYPIATDCNDGNDAINPNATEICDTIDNDCNAGTTDGSGEIAPLNTLQLGVCALSTKTCSVGTWQDDYTGIVTYEASDETTCDTLDNDCDGSVDETLTTTYYLDFDTDSYGDSLTTQDACTQPAGYVSDNTDCNDNNTNINPGETEICDTLDNDCNAGTADGVNEAWFGLTCDGTDTDLCEEGTYQCTVGVQTCSDVSSDNLELCNGADDDCNGATNDGIDEAWLNNPTTCGIGECASAGNLICSSGVQTDTCTEGTPVAETCDNLDNDCNNVIDNDLTQFTLNQNGECSGNTETCNAGVWNPDGGNYAPIAETCNNLDDNCDGSTDENLFQNTTCGLGECSGNTGIETCVAGVFGGDTCDPLAGSVAETCDGLDNDCNGVDDNDLTAPSADMTLGVCVGSVKECAGVSGWVEPNYTLLNDYEATEVTCDSLDNNCNNLVDENLTTEFFHDTDSDGFGFYYDSIFACTAPTNYVTDSTDCHDYNASINPNATELLDDVDQNCANDPYYFNYTTNSPIDEGQIGNIDASTSYDYDGGFYLSLNDSRFILDSTNNWVWNTTYNDSGIYPIIMFINFSYTSTLIGNFTSNLPASNGGGGGVMPVYLNFTVNNICTDEDDDGYFIEGGVCGAIDCDDTNEFKYMNTTYYWDNDTDGFSMGGPTTECNSGSIPAGATLIYNPEDCDDFNASVNPNATQPELNCVNDAPILNAVANQYVVASQLLSIQLDAYDPEFDFLGFLTNASFGSLNNGTGLFTWTPTNADVGNYNIGFNVTDGEFTDSINVNVTVLERNATESEGVGYIVGQLPGGAVVEYNVTMFIASLGELEFDVRAEWLDNGNVVIAYFEYNSESDKMNASEQALVDAYSNSYLPFVYTIKNNIQSGVENDTFINVADANSKV